MPHKSYCFRLYVVGGQVGSQRAEPDLRQALDASIAGRYELEVVDLRSRPDLAAADGVMAAPTVIRFAPAPQRRAIGVFVDAQAVHRALDLPRPESA